MLALHPLNINRQFAQEILVDEDVMRKKTTVTTKARSTLTEMPPCGRLRFHLPACLTREYAQRHNLSIQDMKRIIQESNAHCLWMMAAFNNQHIPTSAVQLNSRKRSLRAAAPDATSLATSTGTYVCKKQIVPALIECVSRWELGPTDRIVCPVDEHKPPLPVHFVSNEHMCQLNLLMSPHARQNDKYMAQYGVRESPSNVAAATLDATSQGSLSVFRDIRVVPIEWHKHYLLMGIVITKAEWMRRFAHASILYHPFELCIHGVVHCLTDERFLVQTQEIHKQLVAAFRLDCANKKKQ